MREQARGDHGRKFPHWAWLESVSRRQRRHGKPACDGWIENIVEYAMKLLQGCFLLMKNSKIWHCRSLFFSRTRCRRQKTGTEASAHVAEQSLDRSIQADQYTIN
jgi:hypothetical protein